MDCQMKERTRNEEGTPISRMFDGRSIFITGASGFIGRVLLEKLLRCYPGIRRIYILMRQKKNQQPHERLHKQLLKVPIFDQVRSMENAQQLLDKIVVIAGDIAEPKLGMSEADLQMMLEDKTLSIVFHSAATIKFDEPLKVSVEHNLIATKTIIEFCRHLSSFISLCHVSTAYVNSDLKNNEPIEEKLYPINNKPGQLIKMAEIMDKDLMQILKFHLVDQRPNTYTYTKALAEKLIIEEASDLPVVIVRPSIVVAAWREPTPGWIDNLNGPTGLILAIGKGLLRSMHVSRTVKADIIPVDIVVNTMIASAYYAAKSNNKLDTGPTKEIELIRRTTCLPKVTTETTETSTEFATKTTAIDDHQQRVEMEKKTPTIIHCNSGDLNPITWGQMEDMFFPIIRNYPSCQIVRYPFGSFKSNKYHDLLTRIFVHYLPALIIDMLCGILGRKRQLLYIYDKLHSATGALSHFCTHNYNFKSSNFKHLQSSITNETDRRQLYMDIEHLEWCKFWEDYVLGARRFVLKEEDHTLGEARKSFARAYYIEIALRTMLIILVSACCLPLITGLITSYNPLPEESVQTF